MDPKVSPVSDSPIQEVQWGADPGDLYRQLRFVLKAGQTARVAILDTSAVKALVHFNTFYYYCIGAQCPACVVKPPSPRYLTWTFVYTGDNDGKPSIPLAGAVKAWMFGRDKFGAISQLQSEWGDLRKIDVLCTCTDEKYQRFSIQPARECLWQKDAVFAKTVIDLYKATKVDPVKLISRTVSAGQILGLLSGRQVGDTPEPALESVGPARQVADPTVVTSTPVGPADLMKILDALSP